MHSAIQINEPRSVLAELITPTQLAQKLGIHPRTLRRWELLRFALLRPQIGRQIFYRSSVVDRCLLAREQKNAFRMNYFSQKSQHDSH
jgi:DNA-binding transcriptional MerR regulator